MPHENTASPSPASAGDEKPAKASTEAGPMPGDSTWQEKQDESGEDSQSVGATSRAGASEERRPKPKALVAQDAQQRCQRRACRGLGDAVDPQFQSSTSSQLLECSGD